MKTVAAIIFLLTCLMSTDSLGQTGEVPLPKCEVANWKKPDFDIVSAGRALGQDPVIGIRIVVKEKHINEADLILIVNQVKNRFCDPPKLGVTIFDERKAARQADVIVKHLTGERTAPEIRGFLNSDKTRGINKLGFSPKRGENLREVDVQDNRPNRRP